MSLRHHLRRSTLLPILASGALCVSAYAAPLGTPTRATGHRASQHVCRVHHGKHHPRGCRRHPTRHRRGATPRRAPAAASAATPRPSEAGDGALPASLLAMRCQNTDLTPVAGNIEAVEAATLCLVNQERARHGELPLRVNGELERAAEGHSREMVEQDYFAHVSPDGLTPLARVQDTGYVPSSEDGYTIGENIAWGTLAFSTPQAVVQAWVASPEHLANILESRYRDTAIGVSPAAPAALARGQEGAVYTQEFGVIVQ